MACLSNQERNIDIRICLNGIAEETKADFETWIYSTLEIKSNVVNCSLGKKSDLTLNKYELDNLLNNLNMLKDSLENKRDYTFEFSNYECNFEIKMCTVTIDKAVEIEVWINWGNYTNGRDGGYDVGLRFVANEGDLQVFLSSLREEENHLFAKSK